MDANNHVVLNYTCENLSSNNNIANWLHSCNRHRYWTHMWNHKYINYLASYYECVVWIYFGDKKLHYNILGGMSVILLYNEWFSLGANFPNFINAHRTQENLFWAAVRIKFNCGSLFQNDMQAYWLSARVICFLRWLTMSGYNFITSIIAFNT